MTDSVPRLRFAPSPTGPLHLGGARTALYNWAAARALGGRFLLRIEDTDRARSTDESLQIILAGLRWLGIDWDEGPEVGGDHGPYFQTQRMPFYREAADRLLATGAAYPCYCTPEEIEAGRKALVAAGMNPTYDRRCRDLDAAGRAARAAEGRPASLRFRMPDERAVVVQDLVRGQVEVNTRELDDWVMLRPDGMPLYNFACVVDDLHMAITHVVRGEEHFLNGIKQILLFEALGAPPPRYAHIPLILNKAGKKLSKRDADTNMLDYRDKGFPAAAVFNYIALLGWGFSADRDVFTRDEMVQRFRIGDIGKAGARFDEDKLRWMCGDYIRRMTPGELLEQARSFLGDAVPAAAWQQRGFLENAVACYQERIQLYSELAGRLDWVFVELPEPDEAARRNLARHADAKRWLGAYADALAGQDLPPSFPADRSAADAAVRLPSRKDAPPAAAPCATPAQLEAHAREFAAGLAVKFGDFVHPVRAALTGTDKGPGLFDVLFLLGRERCLHRLRAAGAGC